MGKDRFCVLCVVTSAHGVHGRVKIKHFTESLENVTAYGPLRDAQGQVYPLKITGEAGGMPVAAIEGIKNRNDAEKLRGLELGVPRSALPEPDEGEYYIDDLAGLPITLADGTAYGTLKCIVNYGAGDIAEIALKDGKTELLAFNATTFPVVDVAGGRIVVALPEYIKGDDQA